MTSQPLPDTPQSHPLRLRPSDWNARLLWAFQVLTLVVGALLLLGAAQPAEEPQPVRKDVRADCDAAVAKMQTPLTYPQSDGWCPPTPVAVFTTEEFAQTFSRGLHSEVTTQVGIVVRLQTNDRHTPEKWNQARADFIRRSCMADGFLSYFDDDDGFVPHASTTTVDPLHEKFNKLHWKDLGLNFTPDRTTPPRSRVVAVVDQGTAIHPDLPVSARYEIVDSDKADPRQCVAGVCCPVTSNGGAAHANMVAGAIGAASGNLIGIRGIGDVGQLKSVGVKRANTSCMRRDDVVAGVHCASALGADVINMSIGTTQPSERLGLLLRFRPGPGGLMLFEFAFDPQSREKALKEAVEKAGTGTQPALVVASSGNDGCQLNQLGTRCYYWPGSLELDNVITAEARERGGEMDSSNYGIAYVDLAVGLPRSGDVYCSTNSQPAPHQPTEKCENGYAKFSESSAASAVVAGASTLVWNHPNYQNCTPAQLRHVLIEHGQPYTPANPDNKPKPEKIACMLNLSFLATVENDSDEKPLDKCLNHKPSLGCGKPAL